MGKGVVNDMEFSIFKVETFIPEEYVKELRKSLNDIGALAIGGNYDNCMSICKVMGSWRPLKGADPFEGKIGELCEAEEYKVEFCCRRDVIKEAVDVIKRVHPYEIPVINVMPVLSAETIVKFV